VVCRGRQHPVRGMYSCAARISPGCHAQLFHNRIHGLRFVNPIHHTMYIERADWPLHYSAQWIVSCQFLGN
jgi:hypothetical protein